MQFMCRTVVNMVFIYEHIKKTVKTYILCLIMTYVCFKCVVGVAFKNKSNLCLRMVYRNLVVRLCVSSSNR